MAYLLAIVHVYLEKFYRCANGGGALIPTWYDTSTSLVHVGVLFIGIPIHVHIRALVHSMHIRIARPALAKLGYNSGHYEIAYFLHVCNCSHSFHQYIHTSRIRSNVLRTSPHVSIVCRQRVTSSCHYRGVLCNLSVLLNQHPGVRSDPIQLQSIFFVYLTVYCTSRIHLNAASVLYRVRGPIQALFTLYFPSVLCQW